MIIFLMLLFSIQTFADEIVRRVNLEWEPISNAVSYEVELREKGGRGSRPLTFESSTADWTGDVVPGTYRLRVRGKDRRGVPGAWSSEEILEIKAAALRLLTPKDSQDIIVDQQDSAPVQFQWEPVKGAKDYVLNLTDDDGNKVVKVIADAESKLELKPGRRYTWSVQLKLPDGKLSEPEVRAFTLLSTNMSKPEIKAPRNAFVRELEWRRPAEADAIDLQLFYFDHEWKLVHEAKGFGERRIPFSETWQGGRYRLALWSKRAGRVISDKAEIEFEVVRGDRSPAQENRTMIDNFLTNRSKFFYFVGYVFSQVDYTNKRPDLNSINKFQALTGTLQGGMGRYFTEAWGARILAGLGGITVENQSQYLTNYQAEAVYKRRLSSRMDGRARAGISRHDVLDAGRPIGAQAAQVSSFGTNSLLAGGDVWFGISERWGLKGDLDYRVVIPSQRIATGHVLNAGAFATYNWRPARLINAGLSMRQDQYGFKASTRGAQTIEQVGAYLTLQLELGF